jgi:hypothetical protein
MIQAFSQGQQVHLTTGRTIPIGSCRARKRLWFAEHSPFGADVDPAGRDGGQRKAYRGARSITRTVLPLEYSSCETLIAS